MPKDDDENNDIFKETLKQDKLKNIKKEIQEKKVMEYESETIELYEMLSNEFDFN